MLGAALLTTACEVLDDAADGGAGGEGGDLDASVGGAGGDPVGGTPSSGGDPVGGDPAGGVPAGGDPVGGAVPPAPDPPTINSYWNIEDGTLVVELFFQVDEGPYLFGIAETSSGDNGW